MRKLRVKDLNCIQEIAILWLTLKPCTPAPKRLVKEDIVINCGMIYPSTDFLQLALHRHSSSPVPDKAQKSASPAPARETKDITAHPH